MKQNRTKKTGLARRRELGQALTEFVVMLAMMLFVVFAIGVLQGAIGGHGWRILSLVGLKYP